MPITQPNVDNSSLSLSSQGDCKLCPVDKANHHTHHVISQACPSGHFSPCLTLGTCPHHQVKRNLLNVSYRIAQYTDVISDLRREIEHLKSKIEKQDKEKKSDPNVLDIQGSAKCRPVSPASPDGSVPSPC